MTLDNLLKKLWDDYAALNQQAHAIHALLEKKGEKVVNDHIAFRTYDLSKVNIGVVADPFLKLGYQEKGQYKFEEKKLRAKHFEHPSGNYPRIFISELKVKEFSEQLQSVVEYLVGQVTSEHTQAEDFCVSGVPWKPVSYETYLQLKEESEYAAWLSVFGFRANHFTVLVNSLKTIKSLEELNEFLKKSGFKLNSSGGEIKGTPEQLLEQSSTMADPVEMKFSDSTEKIPSCYYEFARRYPEKDGKLFSGFIAKSADKIFESTDNK